MARCHRAERRRGAPRLGRALRVPPGCRGRARRASPRTRSSTTRSWRTRRGTSIRLSSLFALVPLTWLPVGVASRCWRRSLMLVLLGLTLWLLEVRDVRCYAAALLWVPTHQRRSARERVDSARVRARRPLAIPRSRVAAGALALGLSVSAKLAPLADVRLDARHPAAPCVGCWRSSSAFAVTLAAWAAIGFDGFDGLSRISSGGSRTSRPRAATRSSAWRRLPACPTRSDRRSTFVVGGGAARRPASLFARRGDDVRSFTCAVAATLALTPIVWLHYLVVLLVPLAIARPRFSVIWLLPVLLWVSPKPGYAEGFADVPPGDRDRDPARRVARAAAQRRRPRVAGGSRDRVDARRSASVACRRRASRGSPRSSSAACLPAVTVVTLFVEHDRGRLRGDRLPAVLSRRRARSSTGDSPYPAEDDPLTAESGAYVVSAAAGAPRDSAHARCRSTAAGLVVMLLLVGAVLATLWVLGVRDWRCYGVVLLWPPVLSAIQTGNVTLLLGLARRSSWRFRDASGAAGCARRRDARREVLPLAARRVARRDEASAPPRSRSRSAVGAPRSSRGPRSGSPALPTTRSSCAGSRTRSATTRTRCTSLRSTSGSRTGSRGRSGSPPGSRSWRRSSSSVGAVTNDARSSSRSAAALALTPIVWLHYFALLLVVVALTRPRLGRRLVRPACDGRDARQRASDAVRDGVDARCRCADDRSRASRVRPGRRGRSRARGRRAR